MAGIIRNAAGGRRLRNVRSVRGVAALAAGLFFISAAMSQHQAPPTRRTHRESATPLNRELLDAHNAARARVKVAPLQWSDMLATHAQEWANHLLSRREFDHRTASPYGENLFEITGAGATPATVVSAWASESRNYDHLTNTCRGECGHYTQVVWRNSLRLGCGVARGGGREVWVCNYDPPGNWEGERPF